jgi:hypothetical protein
VLRYAADGCSEHEARLREQVEQLISRHDRHDSDRTRPTTDEIRTAIKACATLDPLAWAETRK